MDNTVEVTAHCADCGDVLAHDEVSITRGNEVTIGIPNCLKCQKDAVELAVDRCQNEWEAKMSAAVNALRDELEEARNGQRY